MLAQAAFSAVELAFGVSWHRLQRRPGCPGLPDRHGIQLALMLNSSTTKLRIILIHPNPIRSTQPEPYHFFEVFGRTLNV